MKNPNLQRSLHHANKILLLMTGKNFKIKINKFWKPVLFYNFSIINRIRGSVKHIPLFQYHGSLMNLVTNRTASNIDNPMVRQSHVAD